GSKAGTGKAGRRGRDNNGRERLRPSGRDHGVFSESDRGGSRCVGHPPGDRRRLVLSGARAAHGAHGPQHRHLRAQARVVLHVLRPDVDVLPRFCVYTFRGDCHPDAGRHCLLCGPLAGQRAGTQLRKASFHGRNSLFGDTDGDHQHVARDHPYLELPRRVPL
ncbi:MAG: Menaquinone-cytochrome C oxidoreductase, cytochrome C subunit, partial [uncultured Rubrobacteraceae bacterium]